MARTWMICPNLWGARLFLVDPEQEENIEGLRAGIAFVREFPRPKFQTRLEDFRDDDDALDIHEPVEDPEVERRVAEGFMQYVAQELEEGAKEGHYDGLLICAEIHLLTILERKLGVEARKRLIGTVAQDLYEANETDLEPYIQDLLGVKPPEGPRENLGRGRAA